MWTVGEHLQTCRDPAHLERVVYVSSFLHVYVGAALTNVIDCEEDKYAEEKTNAEINGTESVSIFQ